MANPFGDLDQNVAFSRLQVLYDAAHRKFDILLVRDLDHLGSDTGLVQQLLNMLGIAGVVVGVVEAPPALCDECTREDWEGAPDDE